MVGGVVAAPAIAPSTPSDTDRWLRRHRRLPQLQSPRQPAPTKPPLTTHCLGIIGVWARRQIKRHRQRSPIGLEARGLTCVSEDMPPAAQCCEDAFAWAAAWWSLQLRRLPPRARYHGPLATWENPVGIGMRGPLRLGPSGGAFDYPSPTGEGRPAAGVIRRANAFIGQIKITMSYLLANLTTNI